MSESVRVLSIDGGGVRGYIPALVLADLERRAGRPAAQLFDLMVGTSTGGIIATGAAVGLTAESLAQFYPRYGQTIFGGVERSATMKRLFGPGATLGGSFGSAARTVGGPFGGNPNFDGNARHRPDGLEQVLREVLADRRLSSVQVELALTTFDGLTSMPVVLSTFDARNDAGFDMLLCDAARATSAAPTYFPPFEIVWNGQERRFVDGGVWANNPAAVAMSEAIRIASLRGITAGNIVLVSLGTGVAPATEGYAGTNSWLRAGADTLALATSVWAGELLSVRGLGIGNVVRLQVTDDRIAGAMDDPSTARLDVLGAAASALIERESSRLDQLAGALQP